jgi:hypothetical protein
MMVVIISISIFPSVKAEDVIIHDNYSSYITSTGSLHVVGEVQNMGDKPVEFVRITATFYDANSTVIATDFTYSALDIIPQGVKSPFEIILLDENQVSKVHNYSLVVTDYEQTSDALDRTLLILSNSSYLSASNRLNIVGEVKNNGTVESTFTKVVVTCYDQNGKVVVSDFSYCDPDTISEGEKAPFHILVIDANQSMKVASYELQAQSNEAVLIPEFPLISIVLFIVFMATLAIIQRNEK